MSTKPKRVIKSKRKPAKLKRWKPDLTAKQMKAIAALKAELGGNG